MKRLSKSAVISTLLLAALTGCYSSNEVPQNVLNEPRVVSPPSSTNQGWPRLGDVPPRPKDFPAVGAVDQAKRDMEDDRAESHVIREDIENPPPAAPSQPSDQKP